MNHNLVEYSTDDTSLVGVNMEKRVVGPCIIARLKSKSGLSIRRTWTRFREDRMDVTLLWFVKCGSMSFIHSSGRTLATSGDIVIATSMEPFLLMCRTDEKAEYDALQITVPTHVLRRFIPQEMKLGFTSMGARREFCIAERMLMDVFKNEGKLANSVTQLLTETAFSVLAHAIADEADPALVRQSQSYKRLQDILRFLDIHLSDANLSVSSVAKGCGISSRYLAYVLQRHGTTFSKVLWKNRLSAASEWLLRPKSTDITVKEIAYRVGFKSTAHFSRMFKRAYRMGPREYRAARLGSAHFDSSREGATKNYSGTPTCESRLSP